MKTDREQLQELMATYGFSIDAKDYDALRECFAAEASAVYETHNLPDRAGIVAWMKGLTEPLTVTQHTFSDFIIDIDGDKAVLRANIVTQHVRFGAPGGDKYLGGGYYNVDAVKSAGKWKIARVAARRLWAEGNIGVLLKI
jgi:hypothetical protein